jgi:putative oxidoreductase
VQHLGLLLLRLAVGTIFVVHGVPKLFGGPGKPVPAGAAAKLGQGFAEAWEGHGGENWANRLEQLGVPMPKAVAYLTGLVELVGGLCVVLGFQTRPAALLLLGQMAVAVQKVHLKNGFMASKGGYEFNLSLIGACLALLLGGPGKVSLDGE